MRARSIIIFCSALLVSFQSKESLQPLSNRLKVYIPRLVSYSADYSLIPIPFDSLAALSISEPFVNLDQQYAIDKTKFKSTSYQNPVIPTDSLHSYDLIVTGEVERVSYEPASTVEESIAAYDLLGWVGLELISAKAIMATYTQYRFALRTPDNKILDSFLVVGVATGNPQERSRIDLMNEANFAAASNFAAELASKVAKLKGLSLQHSSPVYYPMEFRMQKYKNFFLPKILARQGH